MGDNPQYERERLDDDTFLDMITIPLDPIKPLFLMGSPESEEGRLDREGPAHWVSLRPYQMSRTVITQRQWRVIAQQPSINQELDPDPSHFKGENRPVEQVSWKDAQEFCARLSAQTGKPYRLPSEAEWEYACRGGTTTPFHFGETISPKVANYHGDYPYGNGPKGEYREQKTEVGIFSPNGFGLYDMHGNVGEWCQDSWYDSYEGAPIDGTAWENSNSILRVIRGGYWDSYPRNCRSAYRCYFTAVDRVNSFGFRVSCASPRALL